MLHKCGVEHCGKEAGNFPDQVGIFFYSWYACRVGYVKALVRRVRREKCFDYEGVRQVLGETLSAAFGPDSGLVKNGFMKKSIDELFKKFFHRRKIFGYRDYLVVDPAIKKCCDFSSWPACGVGYVKVLARSGHRVRREKCFAF